MSTRRYVCRVLGVGGVISTETVSAASPGEAVRRAAREGATVLEVRESVNANSASSARGVARADAILVLKQLAVMTRSGIELLEAIEIVANSLQTSAVGEPLHATAAALRRGERLNRALQNAAPFYPPYIYALIGAGEASGRLAHVLDEAARQMAFEHRVMRDIQNALVYPGFLVASGAASVMFLFYAVVPRFAEMLRNAHAELSGLSAIVINAGVTFHDNAMLILTVAVLVGFALAGFSATLEGKRMLSQLAHATPGVRTLLLTRQRTTWARIMALGLGAGVDVLKATALAAEALPEGKIKARALDAIPALLSGRPLDQVFLKVEVLSVVDASLVRAGQRSGTMGEMFRAVAERNDEEMRDALKRFTLILEPIAIGVVALSIGAIVLGLASALVRVYESVG